MFDSTKEDLKDILRWADEGRLQLPDFQRDYVWGDDDVKSLIASVAKGFPVGALLTLEIGGSVSFKPRLLQGVPARVVKPDQLLLDGQQRITSLYQAAFGKAAVRTRTPQKKEIERYYYFDIKKCVVAGADLEDAIEGMPADRIKRRNFGKDIDRDLSTPEKEFENHMFPLNQVFDSRDWFYKWRDYWKARGEDVSDIERDFDRGIVDRMARYKMPIIRLDKGNSREAICLVFEKVNVGGKKLDAFELVTAIYASDEFDLREDWFGAQGKSGRKDRIIGAPNRRDVLTQTTTIEFLQACTLLKTRQDRITKQTENPSGRDLPQISCKRDALLALPLPDYKATAAAVEQGFVEAGSFLNEHKIIWHKDVPYPPLIVALASVFAVLGRQASTAAAKEKLSKWFWSIVFGELYGSSTESRLALDVPELVEWISERGEKPRSMDQAIFQQDRLKTLRSRLSAAYKGLHALTMQYGCLDFITGRPTDIMTFFNDKIDIHHIFPEAWCKKQNPPIPPEDYNSIVNKTPLSKTTNIVISGDAPSVYLKRIEQQQGLSSERLDDILRSHLIDPQALRSDDFYGAFKHRSGKLAELIALAMDKPVVQEAGRNEVEYEPSAANDEDATDDMETA